MINMELILRNEIIMHKIILVLSSLYFITGLNSTVIAKETVSSSLYPGVTAAELSHQDPVHWVSVAQIEKSLSGQPSITVGFDIDDTLLFTSAGFYRGEREFSPGSRNFLNNSKFWEKMNNDWNAFSIPKKSGKALMAMHLKRGDKIFFITSRTPAKMETVTKTLQEIFLIPQASINPVIFAGGDTSGRNNKTQLLQEKKIAIYYGDSDNDIIAAQAAGIRGIRVLRAANSNYQPLHKAGAFGEEVIVNSEY